MTVTAVDGIWLSGKQSKVYDGGLVVATGTIRLKVHLKSSCAFCILVRMEDPLTIGQLAARSGVAPSALRFYETRGLIQSVRNRAGHRRYLRAVLRRVAFVVFAQRIGLTLEEVAAELRRLPRDEVPTSADWAKLSARWQQRIDAQIEQLERLRSGLTECIGCGCLSLKKCRLANPGDRAGRYGAGPLVWTQHGAALDNRRPRSKRDIVRSRR